MTQTVRVRFAPSPTGYLHVGGARTAIYNLFHARATGGVFYLRVEDTDRKRYNEQALQDLIRDLRWLGLQWDEGPEAGGNCGPYQQSDRLDIYARETKVLLEKGMAYRCFCSEERLDALRAEQEKNGQATGYDRHCRDMDKAESDRKADAGEAFVVRLRAPLEGETNFHDVVRGHVSWKNALLDDLVLLKRDQFPTYHLASVVDDHFMGTTHVLRGDEWLSSTPKHVLLYQAFGWDMPVFCHLPVILAAGGGKLSKRKGAASVGDFREKGFLPEALVNYLALLGWSPGDDREVMTLEEMCNAFTLERVGAHAVSFDEAKLEWMNGQHIARTDDARLAKLLREYAQVAANPLDLSNQSDDRLITICGLLKSRTRLLTELVEMSRFFFVPPSEFEEKGRRKHWTAEAKPVVAALRQQLQAVDTWSKASLEATFHSYAETSGTKLGALVHPIRLATTGSTVGPGLFELLELLGKDEVLRRITTAEPMIGS